MCYKEKEKDKVETTQLISPNANRCGYSKVKPPGMCVPSVSLD